MGRRSLGEGAAPRSGAGSATPLHALALGRVAWLPAGRRAGLPVGRLLVGPAGGRRRGGGGFVGRVVHVLSGSAPGGRRGGGAGSPTARRRSHSAHIALVHGTGT